MGRRKAPPGHEHSALALLWSLLWVPVGLRFDGGEAGDAVWLQWYPRDPNLKPLKGRNPLCCFLQGPVEGWRRGGRIPCASQLPGPRAPALSREFPAARLQSLPCFPGTTFKTQKQLKETLGKQPNKAWKKAPGKDPVGILGAEVGMEE